jgi:hypothetical protein
MAICSHGNKAQLSFPQRFTPSASAGNAVSEIPIVTSQIIKLSPPPKNRILAAALFGCPTNFFRIFVIERLAYTIKVSVVWFECLRTQCCLAITSCLLIADASMAWDQILQTSLQNLSARQAQVLVNMEEMNEVQEHLKVLVHDIKRSCISISLIILEEISQPFCSCDQNYIFLT